MDHTTELLEQVSKMLKEKPLHPPDHKDKNLCAEETTLKKVDDILNEIDSTNSTTPVKSKPNAKF